MDRTVFFDRVRASLYDGTLSQAAVDGTDAILSAFHQYGDGDVRKLAYCLATAHHETGRFRWLKELWGPTAQQRRYEPPGTLATTLGNTQAGDGKRFMGRGFVHITGRRNYTDWARRLGVDIVGNPALAERPDIAARVLVEGTMLGTFTGRKLADFIGAGRPDYEGARRTVNGTDRAAMIAGYANQYEAALVEAGWSAGGDSAPEPQPSPRRSPAIILAEMRTLQDELEAVIGA